MDTPVILDEKELILDGTKIAWHEDRLQKWQRGERFAPVTVDIALTRACNYGCHFCYAMLQENDNQVIDQKIIHDFLDDAAEIGVRGISLVGDGESSISPVFVDTIVHGSENGISMACASNGLTITQRRAEAILPHLTYLRINFSGGERKRYAEIMGAKEIWFDRVCQNIRDMMAIKRANGLDVTIGMQMVVMPEFADQILPLAKLGAELRPDYLVLKHCSDDEDGSLGVDYQEYERFYDTLREAESYSDETYKVVVKWSKIEAKGERTYQRCYGPPFLVQMSGTGLLAPCSMMFNERYKKFHLGNICEQRFRDIVFSDEYWEVMNHLASPKFNAQASCPTLCLQDKFNEALDDHVKGIRPIEATKGTSPPMHINFI
jgi:MoaA/NifB/PqqE/SkfB family radical SAM enzyme